MRQSAAEFVPAGWGFENKVKSLQTGHLHRFCGTLWRTFLFFSEFAWGQTRKLFEISSFCVPNGLGQGWDRLGHQTRRVVSGRWTVVRKDRNKAIFKFSETRSVFADNSFRNGHFHVPLSSGTRPERRRNGPERFDRQKRIADLVFISLRDIDAGLRPSY